MHLPPWDDKTGGRVWPNVIPLPEGYPARYMALMMDRLNFPDMKGSNWTYGAMYLYHAHPTGGDQLDYEYIPFNEIVPVKTDNSQGNKNDKD